ncbi:MAG: integrase/recombinase XerD [Gammaproteobacteria bacterium]|jgi:integrase/recombinase XerD
MIEAMRLRGFSAHTQPAYLYAVVELAEFYGRCPSRITDEALKAYFRHLVLERGFSPSTYRVRFHGIRFLLRAGPGTFGR